MVAKGDVLDQVRSYRSAFPEGFVPVLGFTGVEIYRRATDLSPREARVTGITSGLATHAPPAAVVN